MEKFNRFHVSINAAKCHSSCAVEAMLKMGFDVNGPLIRNIMVMLNSNPGYVDCRISH